MRAAAVAAGLVLIASAASAQISIGVTGSKNCPGGTFNAGDVITCNFTLTNNSTNAIVLDSLTETFPCVNNHIDNATGRVVCDSGSGTPFTAQCLQGSTAVTTLGAGGTATASCSGTVTNTVPDTTCGQTGVIAVDRIALDFHDATSSVPNFSDSTSQVTVDFPPCGATGRMTGGGSVFTEGNARVTHGFEIHCNVTDLPNNLEVNWGGGNNFHMTELLTAVCTDDPAIDPHPPGADFDTFVGTGTGRCNGVDGASISFTFTDAGEPGKVDTARINISGCEGLSLSVSGHLKKGNQQAHNN